MIKNKYTRKKFETRKANGLCLNCGKPMDREGRNCIACTERNRKYNNETRAMRKKYGVCPRCGKEKLWGNEKNCPECTAKQYKWNMATREREHYNEVHRVWQKAEHHRRIAEGICTRCGKRDADSGYKTCGVCRDRASKYYRANYSNPNRKEKRLEAGLCFYCDNPVKEGYKVCEHHYELNVINQRKANRATARRVNNSMFRKAVNQ